MPKSKDIERIVRVKGDRPASTLSRDYTKDRKQWLSDVTVEEVFGDRGMID